VTPPPGLPPIFPLSTTRGAEASVSRSPRPEDRERTEPESGFPDGLLRLERVDPATGEFRLAGGVSFLKVGAVRDVATGADAALAWIQTQTGEQSVRAAAKFLKVRGDSAQAVVEHQRAERRTGADVSAEKRRARAEWRARRAWKRIVGLGRHNRLVGENDGYALEDAAREYLDSGGYREQMTSPEDPQGDNISPGTREWDELPEDEQAAYVQRFLRRLRDQGYAARRFIDDLG
jgi:hypothetical protein